jgi:hypothetical protein
MGLTQIHQVPPRNWPTLLQVQENERHRLSRELHDDIGQLLTAAKLQSEWLKRRLPQDLQGQCTVLCSTLDETLAKVRDVSAILNPRQLTSLGWKPACARTCSRPWKHRALEPGMPATADRHPGRNGRGAFRITQEAVTNMLRHAQAHNLLIRLQRLPGLSLLSATTARASPAIDPGLEGQREWPGCSSGLINWGRIVRQQPAGQRTRIEALFPGRPAPSNGPVPLRFS